MVDVKIKVSGSLKRMPGWHGLPIRALQGPHERWTYTGTVRGRRDIEPAFHERVY